MSKNKQVFVFIWTLFFAYFGYTFIVAPNSDGNHYRVTFLEIRDWVHLQGLSFPDLLSKIYDYYPDPYVPIASYLVALFTDDWHVLFSVYGLVLGYFFSDKSSENIVSFFSYKTSLDNFLTPAQFGQPCPLKISFGFTLIEFSQTKHLNFILVLLLT
jgi:hypothetical protein